MEHYEVVLAEKVAKQVRQVPLQWRTRIQRVFDLLEKNPFLGEKMRGKFEGRYKIRVWPYRVFYYVQKKIRRVEVIEVRHRGSTEYK